MRWLARLMRPVTHPVIVTGTDLRLYVGRVAATALVVALAGDVANQLVFFAGWPTALRSWAITVVMVLVTAVPIALLIARSQRELHAAKRKVEELSLTDPLTGLPNRRAIMDEVSAPDTAVMVLVIVDIDRFKSINDGHGHRCGDAVIRVVAQRLAAELTGASLVGRLGGEEFAVLSSAASLDPLLRSLALFRERLARTPILVDGMAIRVTISAGAAIRNGDEPFDWLYMEADTALYAAKHAGRNRIALSPRLRELGVAQPEERHQSAA